MSGLPFYMVWIPLDGGGMFANRDDSESLFLVNSYKNFEGNDPLNKQAEPSL